MLHVYSSKLYWDVSTISVDNHHTIK